MALVAHKYMVDEMPEEELRSTFAAREHTLDYLVSSLRNQNQSRTLTSYLITGPRGAGKTTIVRMVCLRINEDDALRTTWLPVRFPEELPGVTSLRDLLAATLERLAEQGIAGAQEAQTRIQAEEDDERSEEQAIAALQQIGTDQGKRLILFVENLDQLFDHAIDVRSAATLRRLLMVDPFMMIVGTALRQFEALQGYDEAFFNYFCPVPLGRLNDKQVRDLLFQRARFDGNEQFGSRYREHRAKIKALTQLTGGNPRLVMMLYEVLSHGDFSSAVNTLRKLVDDLTPLLKDILEHQLSGQQRKLLDAIMRAGGTSTPAAIAESTRIPLNSVTQQLKRLKEMQVVEVLGGGKGREAHYTVPDQLFCTWYRMRYLRPHRRRIEMFVEVLRIWFEADERLSALRSLSSQSPGLSGRAAFNAGISIEYLGASLLGTPHEHYAKDSIVTSWLSLGCMEEAALSLAECVDSHTQERSDYEKAAYRQLVNWAVDHGNQRAAIEAAEAAVRKAPDDFEMQIDLGLAFFVFGEYRGAFDCFDRIVSSSPTNSGLKISALFGRGASREMLDDKVGAIGDYSFYIGMVDEPRRFRAIALVRRGVLKNSLGDKQGALADFSMVIEMAGGPLDQAAQAMVCRGMTKGLMDDIRGAIADFSSVVDMEGSPKDYLAPALVWRGHGKDQLGDFQGAMQDYSAVIEMEHAPAEYVARAYLNRGVVKGRSGDVVGGLADSSKALEIGAAEKQDLALARANRGVAKAQLGDLQGALADLSLATEMEGASRKTIARAWEVQGLLLQQLGKVEEALKSLLRSMEEPEADLGTRQRAMKRAIPLAFQCDGNEGIRAIVQAATAGTAKLLLEQRSETFTSVLRALAEPEMKSLWPAVLRSLLEHGPADVRPMIEFFQPVADVLESGDVSRLDPLPPEQREFALQVLRQFEEKQQPDSAGPPTAGSDDPETAGASDGGPTNER